MSPDAKPDARVAAFLARHGADDPARTIAQLCSELIEVAEVTAPVNLEVIASFRNARVTVFDKEQAETIMWDGRHFVIRVRQADTKAAVPGPDPGSFGAVQAGAVPSVLTFEGRDPCFAAGPPLDGPAERAPPLGRLAGLAGFALAWDNDVARSSTLGAAKRNTVECCPSELTGHRAVAARYGKRDCQTGLVRRRSARRHSDRVLASVASEVAPSRSGGESVLNVAGSSDRAGRPSSLAWQAAG